MHLRTLLLSLLVALPAPATPADRALRLRDGTPAERIGIARALFGSGLVDPDAQREMAHRLATGLDAMPGSREGIEELRWYVRVLGGSADATHRPLLERAARSGVRPLAREAAEALDRLGRTSLAGAPYVLPERVRLVEQAEADGCRFLRTHMCRNGDGPDGCLAEHRELAAHSGGNAVLVLTRTDDAIVGHFDTASMVAKHYRCPVPAQGA